MNMGKSISYLYSSRFVVPEVPGRWIKRTGESLVPKILFRNCPDDDPLAGSILAAPSKAGGALVVVPGPSSRGDDVAAGLEGAESESEETVRGSFRACMITEPLEVASALHH
uniref:Uncharacterized protein n=1 Tax=Mus spicilegus TaxID=10103 RepID=A0A8C6GMY7_MUSSI